MNACPVCYALIGDAEGHAGWHRTNDLHGADCDYLRTVKANQRGGVYTVIRPCSCGVHPPEGSDS